MEENGLISVQDSSPLIDYDELMRQDTRLLKMFAARKDAPPAALARLACHEKAGIRTAVAKNPNTPPEALAMLAEDTYKDGYGNTQQNGDCMRAVAQNPTTPPEVLKQLLLNDSHGHINALKNPHTPLVAIFQYILSTMSDDAKGALNFNDRFNDVLRYATRLDEQADGQDSNYELSPDSFSNDDDKSPWA